MARDTELVSERVSPSTLTFASLGLALAVLTVYWPGVTHSFISLDDRTYVVDNPVVTAGITRDGLFWAFTEPHANNYHPLTWLSHMLDCQLFGVTAGKHHIVNVLLHAISTVLLFNVLATMTHAVSRSFVVAALFALHPMRVESVAWIAERKDVLSGVFWMATILAYAYYARRPIPWRYAAVFTLFLLGLLAKQMLVTLPVILLLLDYWPLCRWDGFKTAVSANSIRTRVSWRQLLLEKVPLLALSVAFSVIIVLSQKQGALTGLDVLPLSARVSNAVTSYGQYLWKTIWPTHLAIFYPHPALAAPDGSHAIWRSAGISALVLLAITATAGYGAKRHPYLLVGWGWFLIALLPVSGVVQVGLQGMADRYSYLPLVGIYMMLVWGCADILARVRGRIIIEGITVAAVLVLLTLETRQYLACWRDSEQLYLCALRNTENNYFVHDLLGIEYAEQGRVAEATRQFELSLVINHEYTYAHSNLGTILAQQGRFGEAEAHWQAALAASPDFFDAHKNLGVLYMQQHRPEPAAEHFQEALRQRPGDQAVARSLAAQYAELGELEKAREVLNEALALGPDDAETRRYLNTLEQH